VDVKLVLKMKRIRQEDFIANMPIYIGRVNAGEEFIVFSEKSKKELFKVSRVTEEIPFKRDLGILNGKVTIEFRDDWEMTDEELLGLK
jgi:hypothetical protein